MITCRTYKLSEVVERFCAMQFNDHRRGFKNFLVIAQQVWEEIFVEKLKVSVSMWVPVEYGNPYPVVMLPENMGRFIGIYQDVASCGRSRLVKINPSNSISVAPVVEKTCGCSKNCGCGAVCAEANSLSYTESIITIDGEDYTKKQWFEVCSNGDVMEWLELPTKVYKSTNYTGEFSDEFTDEFSKEMENYEVDTVKLQRRIARVETKPCGCVVDSEANKAILTTYCGCMWDVPVACGGEPEVTYRPRYDNRALEIIGGTAKQYWMRFQPKGGSALSDVPAYCLKAFYDGLKHYSQAYLPGVNPNLVILSSKQYNRSKQLIVEYLNPVNWDAIQPGAYPRKVENTRRYITPQAMPVALPPSTESTI